MIHVLMVNGNSGMPKFFWVGLAGGLATLLRHEIFIRHAEGTLIMPSWLVALSNGFPALLAVNLMGGLLAGLAANLPAHWLSPNGRVVLIIGFCGGLTTFSAFSQDLLTLLLADPWQGLLFAVTSVVLGILAVAAGYVIAGWLY